ncbi:MAG: methyltransferase domain-containing protein [Pseudomonadota bacterium]
MVDKLRTRAAAPLTKWMAIHFDAHEYLQRNPDLKTSGIQSDDGLVNHFVNHGFAEGREFEPDRRQRVLADLDLTKPSVEFGALTNPLLPRGHPNAKFADHASTSEIAEKYRHDANVNVADIVDVDFVIDDTDMSKIFGAETKFSLVVASHVIEHVPDLVGGLNALAEILAQDGQIRLVVPDKRFTFDLLRDCSEFDDVVGPYFSKPSRPEPAQLFDNFLYYTPVDAKEAWLGTYLSAPPEHLRTARDALKLVRKNAASTAYADAHCWVFTPLSFVDLFLDLVKLDLCQFKCAHFAVTTAGANEFIVGLEPCKDTAAAVQSWQIARATALLEDWNTVL